MANSLAKVNPKNTTQSAFLEEFLARMRTRKILPFTKGKQVLDFGCGEHLWTLKALRNHAKTLNGIDILYQGLPPQKTDDGITVFGTFQQMNEPIDCIVSLACFEHIEPELLPGILKELHAVSLPAARLVGTVPRPPAKPVLEFLSYRLRLIDASQIMDHKIYYNEKSLREVAAQGGWELEIYQTFQLRMNSLFVFKKKS